MNAEIQNVVILTTKAGVKPECLVDFAEWQARFNVAIANYPGFISLEILSPATPENSEWLIVQRFHKTEDVESWRQAEIRKRLMDELKPFLIDSIQEISSSVSNLQGGVTEMFIAQINPKSEGEYRVWMAKIHEAEAKFPGFKGVHMQSPGQSGGTNWVTLLQFDTQENLDRWLQSPERQKVLAEAEPLISSLETHRVISPYAGWFASLAKEGVLPPVWKQTMIVLLILFPIVMIELKYLSKLTAGLEFSLATFIGNAISVTLIAWPLMPIAIKFLGWWLVPKNKHRFQATFWGTLLILLLYLVEIVFFWKLHLL